MTQEDIDEIARSKRSLVKMAEEYKGDVARIETYIRELEAKCDHTYPSGETALEGNMFCTSCRICPWSDL